MTPARDRERDSDKERPGLADHHLITPRRPILKKKAKKHRENAAALGYRAEAAEVLLARAAGG